MFEKKAGVGWASVSAGIILFLVAVGALADEVPVVDFSNENKALSGLQWQKIEPMAFKSGKWSLEVNEKGILSVDVGTSKIMNEDGFGAWENEDGRMRDIYHFGDAGVEMAMADKEDGRHIYLKEKIPEFVEALKEICISPTGVDVQLSFTVLRKEGIWGMEYGFNVYRDILEDSTYETTTDKGTSEGQLSSENLNFELLMAGYITFKTKNLGKILFQFQPVHWWHFSDTIIGRDKFLRFLYVPRGLPEGYTGNARIRITVQ